MESLTWERPGRVFLLQPFGSYMRGIPAWSHDDTNLEICHAQGVRSTSALGSMLRRPSALRYVVCIITAHRTGLGKEGL
jgi:hypothetical protein